MNQKKLWELSLNWREKKGLVLFLLTKLILLLEKDLLKKMKYQEGSKQNFLFRCKELEMNVRMYLFWEQQIYHGQSILLSEEDSKKQFISLFLILKGDLQCLRKLYRKIILVWHHKRWIIWARLLKGKEIII